MNRPTFKPLRAFSDSRGYSYFDIFGEPTSGQINIGNLHSGIVKAFHYHREQEDLWFCIKGDIHVILVNACYSGIAGQDVLTLDKELTEVQHHYIGEHNPGVLTIPRGWYHGYKNVGSTSSTLLYWVTKPYNPIVKDEYRIEWDFLGKEIWEAENK